MTDSSPNFVPTIPCNFISIGMTKSGKSHSFAHIFSKIYTRFSYGICFSSTIDLNDDYDFLPKKCKIKEYNDLYVKAIMSKQYNKIAQAKKQGKKCEQHAFIILDDCLGIIDFHHSLFNELFSKSRHLNISVFVLIQHINALSPVMRINAMYTMVTKIKANNISGLYELVSCFSSVQDLKDFLAKNCKDYNCIIFDDMDPYADCPYKIIKYPRERPQFMLQF